MSTVKSLTAPLVGAAIRNGAIASVEAPVIAFVPEMAGAERNTVVYNSPEELMPLRCVVVALPVVCLEA